MSYIFRTIAMSLTLTCLAAPSVIAAEPQAPMTASHHDAATEIRQVVLDMWTAVEAGDVEAYIAHIHPDYTLFGESDIYLQSGKALEHASYSDYLGRYENIRTFMHQPEVRINGDTAWLTYD